MTENKRFWVENERILNTYVIRIYKEDELIFEINNWNSLNESNKVECEGIANELNKLSDENEELKSIKCFADKHGINIFNIDEAFQRCWSDNKQLVKENERIKHIIKEAYNNERTQIGKNVLKQLMEAIE